MAERLLIRDADVVVTMNAEREEILQGSVLIEGDAILKVGTAAAIDLWITEDPLIRQPHRTINASGCVVLPGLVNCHHHLYQTLTRAIGTGRGYALFDWLKMLYPVWAEMNPEAIHVSTQVGLAELILSGATTVADHLYLFPNGSRLDDEIVAAQAMGVRFHPTRGSMSLGQSQGGLPPDRVVQCEKDILEDSQRVIETFHDPAPRSMLRIGLAPCSPFSVTGDLMRESARLARTYEKVGLHTHLAETLDEERFCLEKFGKRPLDYAESVEWVGPDVWFAHMVHPSDADIDRMAHQCSGVCHCASSNMILASGIAPVRKMVDRGVRVGLGVDGSASNDGNHLLGEARQAMLLQRVGWPGFESSADRFSAREALELATLGGARVLGRDDIGSLETGKAADVVAFRVDDFGHAGALGDRVAALLTCAPGTVWLSVINGRVVVDNHQLIGVDLPNLIKKHNLISHGMLRRAGIL
ncbi:8-oxoguanine deaminase [Halothiobacillus neapolitanus]|uniref:Amidohydrolase n=1 Tax=Halothiobacillus neapolitanus (strain ATCC 23641 / DSM 15147 / CIP 104769 / NCIMB 8539 / c2) TaxID=555778 RepID=D0KZ13_HALNC|nr:8-oxoguanine deaminase [Halothiobacillus neapolitanus]ACX95686.1 amidohydrolase [Halothiobacillus neapolitanus c2]TDN65992.1 cytosine/adenosine deaminase-related metal-dependent hydrolase [Halothiobacillus neapolitanus]